MDDPARSQQNDDAQQPTNQQTPAQPSDDQQQQHVPPVVPSGSLTKERGPVASAPGSEYLQSAPHERTPEVHPEAASHVETVQSKDQPHLTQEQRKLGFREAHEAMPAPKALSDAGSLMVQIQNAQSQQKNHAKDDSITWKLEVGIRQMFRSLLFKEKQKI